MKKHENAVFVYAVGAVSLALSAVVLAPLGCSGDDDGCAESGCTGGTGGTGATGGSAGTGGTGGSAGSGGTAGDDAGPGEPCGGIASIRCSAPETMFCDYGADAECGEGDMTGTCMPRPATCAAGGPGVCGCNGMLYTNECEAHRAGTDDHPNGTCTSPAR
jgi:hypothetical protein